jgi:hypothetical protein
MFDPVTFSRRAFLERSAMGFGSLALAHLLGREGRAADDDSSGDEGGPGGTDLSPRVGHFPARARSVILLMQNGGPSQMDLFDPKPELQKRSGQRHPQQVESFQPGSQANLLMGSAFRFRKHGECGMELSELLPHIGSVADDICLVRSMVGDNNNHPQGLRCINTGKIFPGRPTFGAWVSYALGTLNQNLPAYIALRDPDGYNNGGTTLWENGWLPALFGGTEIQSRGAAVLNLHPAKKLPSQIERNNLALLADLNEDRRQLYPADTELEARIKSYELAARMQLHAERLLDLSHETVATRRLYGLDNPVTANFGTRCLMARRLVEAGVRYIQVTAPISSGTMPWDHHNDIVPGLKKVCPEVDQPSAALIRDLKQRGLLDTTIVWWTGEFGRLPITQVGTGRDHNRYAFSTFLAGGGFRPGHIHGATDEFGYKSVEKIVNCPSLLATLMYQLGIDHTRLSYPHQGRDETLTDPAVTGAHVVGELLTNRVFVT